MEDQGEGGEGEGEADPNTEAPGTGINKYTYFAATSPLAKWTKLPHLSPDIMA